MLSVPKSSVRQPRKWTPAEDQKLREEVEEQQSSSMGINTHESMEKLKTGTSDFFTSRKAIRALHLSFIEAINKQCRIAQNLPGRTNKDCRKRWMNSVVGTLKKGQWSKSEDVLLAKGVERFGQKWTLVADMVVSRSADQCSKRWCQSLDPELDRSEWRESEDAILIEAVQRLGRHWKDVQRYHFQGRSKNSIKNRYTVLLRRFQTRDVSLPEGPDTPEASSSNRLSTYSATDDETQPYTSGMYDEMISTQTQVSTPESRHSWSMNDDSYSNWSTPAAYGITSTANPSPTRYQHQSHANVHGQPQWNWAPSSVGPSPIMANAYANAFAPPPISPYNAYGQPQGIYGPPTVAVPSGTPGVPANASYTVPRSAAPTSSPRSASTVQYQDPQSMNRYMRYGMPGDQQQYRY